MSELPSPWVERNGHIYSDAGREGRPIVYRVGKRGWMITGSHSAAKLKAIADWAAEQEVAVDGGPGR